MTDWDRQCGFRAGDDVVGARRAEDEEALRRLDATPRWLDFLDRQYDGGRPPDEDKVATAIREAVETATLVASPLGLMHPDHLATAAACLTVARAQPPPRWLLYEDAIYRDNSGNTDAALSALRNDGFVLSSVAVPEAKAKRAAIAAYTSQVRGLGALVEDAYRPERYWELSRR